MNELLAQGIAVMCIGMGTVLAFLCITILSMFIMSAVVRKLNTIFPEVIPQPAGGRARKASASDDAEIAVAILSAMFKK